MGPAPLYQRSRASLTDAAPTALRNGAGAHVPALTRFAGRCRTFGASEPIPLLALQAQDFLHERFLRVEAVFGLIDYFALGAVDDISRHLETAPGG